MVNYRCSTGTPASTAQISFIATVSVKLYQSVTDTSGQNEHIGAREWLREAKRAKLHIQILLETKVINK